MKVILNGANGRMGGEVLKLLANGKNGSELAAAVDANAGCDVYSDINDFNGEADIIIDFSHHSAAKAITEYAVKRNLPLIVATTGHTDEETEIIRSAAAKIPVFFSANMSLGIAVLIEIAKKTASAFPDADIEIVESHHNRKLDAPSGTALMLLNSIKDVRKNAVPVFGRYGKQKREKAEIGVHSLRCGNEPGMHEIIVATDSQIITLKHEARDRAVFAEGALDAASFLMGKEAGLYTMKDMI